jgi:hypothetical protein
MSVYIILSRFTVVEHSANASTANPGQQENFIVLTLDSFQNSMLQENNKTPQRFRRKHVCDGRPTSIKL